MISKMAAKWFLNDAEFETDEDGEITGFVADDKTQTTKDGHRLYTPFMDFVEELRAFVKKVNWTHTAHMLTVLVCWIKLN